MTNIQNQMEYNKDHFYAFVISLAIVVSVECVWEYLCLLGYRGAKASWQHGILLWIGFLESYTQSLFFLYSFVDDLIFNSLKHCFFTSNQ